MVVALPKSHPQLPNRTISPHFIIDGRLEGWEELVQVEWEGVELLAAWVCLERPEPVPEMVSPVLPHCAVTPVQSVVQKICYSASDKCF